MLVYVQLQEGGVTHHGERFTPSNRHTFKHHLSELIKEYVFGACIVNCAARIHRQRMM